MNIKEATAARVEFLKNRAESGDREDRTREPEDVGAGIAQLVKSIIPEGMAVTPPDKYRAYIFKTLICPALKSRGFEERFWQDNLFANVAKGSREAKQKWVMGKVENYLVNTGAIVALVGDRGLGKTTICAQIAIKHLWEDWESSLSDNAITTCRTTSYRKLNNIVAKIKGLYADFGSIRMEEMEMHRDFLCGNLPGGGADLLIIDELNEASEDSKFKDRVLADIADRRYAKKLDTVLITNQPADVFKATTNTSVLSRLNEHGDIIACEWESFRDTPASPNNEHPSI